ncbi:hypothetical protein Thpro_021851 [Acidihalobacter prosperus]|uniref:STAS domain-containing protein n=1 Tax=Acidihalobacter prosperus TaxID=160660 RepID=A0A1A6C4N7_9GAMM|nr:hypothetical protein Thpro_021851 [Acidihalobacter prosperus]
MLRREADGTIALCGELDAAGVPSLRARLQVLAGSAAVCRLELATLDLLDAGAVIGMLEAVRSLVSGGADVTLVHAPQTLAHTLYRVGALGQPGLFLVEPREEEPYA